ncbi:hypothetical protein GCM10007876_21310 [Litoribrevibacter albus]|uniref:SGNH hydrolase-type esterase domain-containing protein n=2 Tax=Litoribrevibacter albus TaxID=1473156 RepID=A0AA37SBU3_9GAMM|nr:hypothetical protein GCM10007876_21310 [Litoribrevibacter albus]
MLDIDTVVIFGASIMEQSFSDSEDTVSKFLDAGIFVDVFERATSGDDTTQMLAKLPAVITEFQSIAARTLFVIHWGGNDVSRDGPFPGGADTMEANMRSMLSDIKSAGFKIMMSDISYRVPPASNPSQPYNDAFMYQLQSEYNDVDWFLQQFTFDNQVDIETDGIHPGAVLEEKIRQYLVVQSKAYIKPVAVETSIVKDLVIEFGAGALLKYRSQLNSIDANGTIFDLRNSDYSKIVGSSVTVTGAYGTNTSGRGNTADIGNDTASLFNDECLKDSLYITSSDTIYVDLSGLPLDDAGLYTVGVTASRKSDTGTKVSEYTVDGITLALDAELSPPGQVYFNNVTGANLRSNGIQVAVQDGSSFGYIGIASITEAG